jgi:hypothetical protein
VIGVKADTAGVPDERTTKVLTMTATAHEVADTLNRAFDEPSMTMPILLADVIPALAEFGQDATTAADPDDYRDRIVLHDGSVSVGWMRCDRCLLSGGSRRCTVTASRSRRGSR